MIKISEENITILKDNLTNIKPDFENWLTSKSYPKEFIKFLNKYLLFKNNFTYKSVRFDDLESVMEWNDFMDWSKLSRIGYYIFGSALNGDQFCIRFTDSNYPVYIFPHDASFENNLNNIDTFFIELSGSFDTFLTNLRKEIVPTDYYAAQDELN